jgi:hypothetical protein
VLLSVSAYCSSLVLVTNIFHGRYFVFFNVTRFLVFVKCTKNVGEGDVQLNLSSEDSGHNGNLSLAENFYRPENLASRGSKRQVPV